ncbi:MAG: LysR family transcriptional regulator [Desulfomonile tiedjei]|nr:LysR family transcriptional regulator [Desulfomonile tiedjei]
MDMRRLEVLCKVIELKSFTKAAEALLLSQPTVSEHIRSLEEALGERLIDRLGREVLATPAGRVFYQYARNIIQLREEAVQALEQFKGNLSGHLTLGASTIPGTYVVPRFIGSFKAIHPAIQMTLRISDTAQIVRAVLEGDLEAGMIGSKWNDRRILLEELFTDELILAVFSGHPWARKKRISPDEMIGEPFILRERGSGTRMVMERILEEHGFDASRLFVVAEMGSTEAVRQGIKARIGVSILSRQAVEDDMQYGALEPVEIDGIRFYRPLYLVQRRNRRLSPLCEAFLAHLRTAVKEAESAST